MDFVYYLLTEEATEEQRRQFDIRAGLAEDPGADESLLPEALRGVEPPDWWNDTTPAVNANQWAAGLG